jgi:ABC-type multidrug transport system fused ATPase/permease subunit
MNRNLILTQPDPEDNPKVNIEEKPKSKFHSRDWTKLILGLFSFFFLFWLVFMFAAVIYCFGEYQCVAIPIAFWSFPVFLLFVSVVVTLSWLIYAIQSAKNIAYLNVLGTKISRAQLDKFTPEVIQVALRVAQSMATTGLDTYSPSIQTNRQGKIDDQVEESTGILIEGDAVDIIKRHS